MATMPLSPNVTWLGSQLAKAVGTLVGGILWILAACWFVHHEAGNPLDELALIRHGQVAAASLVDTVEGEAEDYRGHVHCYEVGVYAYRLPDGREFKTTTKAPTGELEEQQEVEYLPENPAVSRIKGDGCQSVVDWLCRKVLGGGLLLAMLGWPGVFLVQEAIRDVKRLCTVVPSSPQALAKSLGREFARSAWIVVCCTVCSVIGFAVFTGALVGVMWVATTFPYIVVGAAVIAGILAIIRRVRSR